ncbi:SNF2 family N-terminal domain containing protein [Tritrichomonas foetus]|uniref:SNF2 family N-terminal domain containing protein n=1 Tax=Tritrichomonas foetus TaxID=1144522 RepID=A0A1J4JEN9_9EUKA|nr:SNF2 family N-terminal domain containing protein [Tritrichomonas foetus]|eukprot:OHS97662.1 SNF2 family N-terminal domain containing protein [Tritrichomonas foetus]
MMNQFNILMSLSVNPSNQPDNNLNQIDMQNIIKFYANKKSKMSRNFSDESSSASSSTSGDELNLTVNQNIPNFIIGANYRTIDDPSKIDDLLFYVKFKEKPYNQCQWLTFQTLCKYPGGNHLISRFMRNKQPFIEVNFIENLFKPFYIDFDQSYITPTRILSVNDSINGNYFVKFGNLPYSEAGFVDAVPQNLIDAYYKRIGQTNSMKFIYDRDISSYEHIPKDLIFKNNNQLTPYQHEGLDWLYYSWCKNRNALLADEMGLGKTIQCLAFFEYLKSKHGIYGPFIVVCPLATINNWYCEAEKWTDFRIVYYYGNDFERENIRNYEIFAPYNKIICDIILTSYETVSNDQDFFNLFRSAVLVFDEAHRLKNPKARITNVCKALESDFLILMTGTPIQNSIEELWSLLNLLDPIQFSNLDVFMQSFKDINNINVIHTLQQIIEPFILRRKKADVETSITPKEETIIQVEMTEIQWTLYKAILDKDRDILLGHFTKNSFSLNNIMMQLRKLCNHPFLLGDVEEMATQYIKIKKNFSDDYPDLENEALILSSGKMILLDKLLPKLMKDGHKVLIFSQMTSVLDILEDFCNYRKFVYERLDGSMTAQKRVNSILNFTQNTDCFIFLLSTRAGGFGLNLTAADTVILYDSDWNPQNDLQAQSRVHRIGQTKSVKVYRLVTHNTYEKEMFERASHKMGLDYAILDSHEGVDDDGELEMILKKGAYYSFADNNHTEIDKFCEEDIEQILSTRAQTVNKDFISGGNSLFANVKFTSEVEKKINVNEPDFWKKILPTVDETTSCRRKKKVYKSPPNSQSDEKKENKNDENSAGSDSELHEGSSDFTSEFTDGDDEAENYSDDDADISDCELYQVDKYLQKDNFTFIISDIMKHGVIGIKQNNSNIYYEAAARAIVNTFFELQPPKIQMKYQSYIDYLFESYNPKSLLQHAIKNKIFYSEEEMIVQEEYKNFLDVAYENDSQYLHLLTLISYQVPIRFGLSHPKPPFWTPFDDYLLLINSEKFIDSIKQNKVSASWIEDRKILMTHEIKYVAQQYAPKWPKDIPKNLPPYSRFSNIITKHEIKQLYRTLFFFGFPIAEYVKFSSLLTISEDNKLLPNPTMNREKRANIFSKIQELANLKYIHLYIIENVVMNIISQVSIVSPYLEKQYFYAKYFEKVELPKLPINIFIPIAINIEALEEIRTFYEKHQNEILIWDCGQWEIAPSWWMPANDHELFQVTAKFGFTTLVELLRTMPKDYIQIPSERLQFLRKEEMLNCSLFNSSELNHLQFMMNIDQRRNRVCHILNVYRNAVQNINVPNVSPPLPPLHNPPISDISQFRPNLNTNLNSNSNNQFNANFNTNINSVFNHNSNNNVNTNSNINLSRNSLNSQIYSNIHKQVINNVKKTYAQFNLAPSNSKINNFPIYGNPKIPPPNDLLFDQPFKQIYQLPPSDQEFVHPRQSLVSPTAYNLNQHPSPYSEFSIMPEIFTAQTNQITNSDDQSSSQHENDAIDPNQYINCVTILPENSDFENIPIYDSSDHQTLDNELPNISANILDTVSEDLILPIDLSQEEKISDVDFNFDKPSKEEDININNEGRFTPIKRIILDEKSLYE